MYFKLLNVLDRLAFTFQLIVLRVEICTLLLNRQNILPSYKQFGVEFPFKILAQPPADESKTANEES